MKKITTIALLALTANVFAVGEFSAGSYKNGSNSLTINSEGDYEATINTVAYVGFHMAGSGCKSRRGTPGNLRVVSKDGVAMCYRASTHGNRLIIEDIGGSSHLAGIWIEQ